MPRVCKFTGKKTSTGITKRTFKPNLQKVNAIIDGKPVKIRVSTKAIKSGLVVKPLKRKYGYTRVQKLAAAAA